MAPAMGLDTVSVLAMTQTLGQLDAIDNLLAEFARSTLPVKSVLVYQMSILRFLIAATLLSVFALPTVATPEVGDQAPEFNLQASDGKTYSLAQHKGQQGVVIAFFPKAFTGG